MTAFWWLLGLTLPFILAQVLLHREIQYLFLIMTRRLNLAVGLFSLLFFPGVLLHELSHLLAALLLRVPVKKFSLIPHTTPTGRVRLGYVQTNQVDVIRDALIGTAPLISGGAVIALISHFILGLPGFFTGDFHTWWQALQQLPSLPDFWIWFYLLFTISSTMLPSESDRHAWLPIILVFVLLLILVIAAGAGPWMKIHVLPVLSTILPAVSAVIAISLLAHLVLLVPAGLLRSILGKSLGISFTK